MDITKTHNKTNKTNKQINNINENDMLLEIYKREKSKFKTKYPTDVFLEENSVESKSPVKDSNNYVYNSVYDRFMNPKNRIVLINTVKDEVTKYYLVKMSVSKIVNVSKEVFSNSPGSFRTFRGNSFKFDYGSKEQHNLILKKLSSELIAESETQCIEFAAESLMDSVQSINDFISGVRFFISSASFVGKFSRKLRMSLPYTSMLVKITRLFISLLDVGEKTSITNVLLLCMDVWDLISAWNQSQLLIKGESLNEVMIASLLSLLPNNLTSILKRLQMLTNTKILDDFQFVTQVYKYVHQFIEQVLKLTNYILPASIQNWIKDLFDLQPLMLIREMDNLHAIWKKDPLIILQDSFREKAKNIQNSFDNYKDTVVDWFKKSAGANSIHADFVKLTKSIAAYESSSKIEPSCFVFEGKPGTMKSCYINKLIAVSGLSSYAHTTQSATTGKDWYDAYNNENIFYMDDVGSQDISQFRNLVNFVSPVKTPLECASADLKDTKFFSSEYIFLTTNNFSKLNNVTKGDGISNIVALWRRGNVFSFDKVVRVGGSIRGTIIFKHFNILTNTWQEDFPLDIKEYFSEHEFKIQPYFNVTGDNEYQFVAWMSLIIESFGTLKKQQHHNNLYGFSDIDRVKKEKYKMMNIQLAPQSNMGEFSQRLHMLKDYVEFQCSRVFEYLPELEYTIILIPIAISLIAYGCINIVRSILSTDTSPLTISLEAQVQKPLEVEQFRITAEKHNTILAVEKQVFAASFSYKVDDRTANSKCTVLLTNKFAITTNHSCLLNDAILTVYKDEELNHRIVDNLTVTKVYKNESGDIAIWAFPTNYPTPFRDLSHIFNNNGSRNRNPVLITIWGAMDVSTLLRKPFDVNTPYSVVVPGIEKYTNLLGENNVAYQKLQGSGLCGSPLMSDTGKFLGHHVAGAASINTGIAISHTQKTIEDIYNVLRNNHTPFSLDIDMSEKVIPDFSGIKLNKNYHMSTPKKSNYSQSVLHNIFPISRVPAPLNVNGAHTVKDVAKKSFKPVVEVPINEIKFGKLALSKIINEFAPISMAEVVNGNEVLAGLNKKSSSGYGFPLTKEEYIDYEKGTLKEGFKQKYELFKSNLAKGVFNMEEIVWFETLKDELRSVDKDLPRSFRVSTILMQILTKELFGNMVAQIVNTRNVNGVMIGINPYSEWDDLYKEIRSYDHVWAADLGNWDGGMNPQVQNALNEVIIDKFQGDKTLANYVLGFLPNCLVAVNDDTYLTTHSMPSGSFLTAIYNSLINKFYTAMWFYRYYYKFTGRTPTVDLLNTLVLDKVYGDDRVNGVIGKSFSFLNAITMKEFFNSLGMKFTDSKKGEIIEKEHSIRDITFLKREFVYHSQLQQIVGPLDLSTLYSTLSWVDESKDVENVMKDKVNAFQREIYLHEKEYDRCIISLRKKCEEVGLYVKFLSAEQLSLLYKNNEYAPYSETYGVRIQNYDDDLSAFKRVFLQNSA